MLATSWLHEGSRMTTSLVSDDLKARAELLDVRAVAELLSCSPRHVYRLSDGGRMPPPVRLGGLVRWSRAALLAWMEQGCRPVRQQGRG